MVVSRRKRSGNILLAAVVIAMGLFPAIALAYPDPPVADKKVDAPKKADTEKKEKPGEKTKAVPVNPLSRFIKRLLPGNKTKPADDPANREKKRRNQIKARSKKAPVQNRNRDHIDSRAPQDSLITKKFRRAKSKFEEQDWEGALELLQNILDPPARGNRPELFADSLILLPDGRWSSVHNETIRLLGQLPPEHLARYRRQTGPKARVLLREAEQRYDLHGIVSVAARFFHTEAGQRAANFLGTHHFDRGEFGMAARWFTQLAQSNAGVSQDPKWRMKAAFSLRQAGRESEAELMLKEFSGSLAKLELGGVSIDPNNWLKKTDFPLAESQQFDEWLLFYGSPSRTGTAQGGEPLLLPRWSHTSTSSKPIRQQIQILIEDLSDAGRVTIPAMFPLTVNGKVIFRTLRGVQVVDAKSGEKLWTTEERISPERVLMGLSPQTYQQFNNNNFVRGMGFGGGFRAVQRQSGQAPDSNPLTSLLFRDGTHGILSSDGDRLFVIEDRAAISHAMNGYGRNRDLEQSDPYRRSWSSNRLTSYDLETGRPLWDVGGREMNEPFDPPLAGNYFFGAPVVDGGELFIVGEKNGEIRLHALDAQLGTPLWSQLIAYADVGIDKDIGRRWMHSQLAVSDGVVVCPTTVGWLVAVDRLKQTVLWAHRYSKAKSSKHRNSRDNSYVQMGRLNQNWFPSAPVVVGHRLIYTPAEENLLVCLNIFDGSRLWKKMKGRGVYLAGVFGERVVVVGSRSVVAYSLKDGTSVWNRAISSSDGAPSGFGVAVGNRYHLPLNSGRLWTIDLTDGSLLSTSQVHKDSRPLGNLAMYGGMLLSQDAFGLSSFEQREAIENEIQKRKTANPNDFLANLRESDIHSLNREHQSALTSLHQIDIGTAPASQMSRYRKRMTETLSQIIRSDFLAHDQEMEELSKFANTADEKKLVRRVAAERFAERKVYDKAFQLFWDFASENNDAQIVRDDDPRISVKLNHWVAGKLADLWQTMPEETRANLDSRIAEAAQRVSEADISSQQRFSLLFAFHPASTSIRLSLVQKHVANSDIAQAENLLLKLATHSDPAVATDALARLLRLLTAQGLEHDAAFFAAQLAERFPNSKLADVTTANQPVEQPHPENVAESSTRLPALSWGDADLHVEQSGTDYGYTRSNELFIHNSRLPFYRQYRMEIRRTVHNWLRLNAIGAADESLYWSLPLRSAKENRNRYYGRSEQIHSAYVSAHQMVLVHNNMLHCLSLIDKRTLWTMPIDSRGQTSREQSVGGQHRAAKFFTGSRILSHESLKQRSTAGGMVAVANGRYVCVHSRRSFQVLDAMTGDLLWTYNNLPKNTKVYGTDQTIYVVPQNRIDAVALRALDGKKLDVDGVAKKIWKSIHVSGNSLVQLDSKLGQKTMHLALRDPVEEKTYWQTELSSKSKLALLNGGYLVVINEANRLQLIDLETGKRTSFDFTFEKSDLKSISELLVVDDADSLYLFLNKRSSTHHSYQRQLSSHKVNGLLLAFDLESRKLIWKQQVGSKGMIRTHLKHSPVLVFYSQERKREQNISYQSTNILVLDKKTGRKLLDWSNPTYADFQSFDINMQQRYVELRSHDRRYRLVANDPVAEAKPVSAVKPVEANKKTTP